MVRPSTLNLADRRFIQQQIKARKRSEQMHYDNEARTHGDIGDFSDMSAEDLARELAKTEVEFHGSHGTFRFPYWLKRLAAVLRATQKYRTLDNSEQKILKQQGRYGMEESLSKRLDKVLFGD